MIRKRLFQVLRSGLLLLCIGILYSIFLQKTGIGLVCPVNFLTGLKCPGCGVSHMCIALMQFDFVTAFQANPVLLLLSPVLAVVGLQYLMHYIKTGAGRCALYKLYFVVLYCSFHSIWYWKELDFTSN